MNLDGSSVDWDDEFWAYARSWKLFDVGGSVLGYGDLSLASSSGLLDSNGASLDVVRAGSSFGLSLSGGDIYLTYTAVPEPSAYGLALGALALAGAALRRRRASR